MLTRVCRVDAHTLVPIAVCAVCAMLAHRLRPLLAARGRFARVAVPLRPSTTATTAINALVLAPKAKLLLGVLDVPPSPQLAVRVCGMVVFSSVFSTMAKTLCMDAIFDDEVDMSLLDGALSDESCAEEHAKDGTGDDEQSDRSERGDGDESDVLSDAERSSGALSDDALRDRGTPSDGGAAAASDGDASDDDDIPEPIPEFAMPSMLVVGETAEHDMLGKGTVLAIESSGQAAPGVNAAFEEHHKGKVLFSFVKRVSRSKVQLVERWVFEDALTSLARDGSDVSAAAVGSAAPSGTSAFDEMCTHALEPDAFTQGMSAPEMAAHERKRKAQNLKDAPVRGHNQLGRKTKEPNIDPLQRVAEFPDNSLAVDNFKLYCKACLSELSLRKTTIATHVSSEAHKKALTTFVSTLSDDEQIGMLLSQYFEKNPQSEMRTVRKDVHVYRWRVTESFMYAGVPMGKIDQLRHLLEREGHALTGSNHMAELYIPQIEEREIKCVVAELLGQYFSVTFDGTTRLGEAINIVTRSITDDFVIRMRLVGFKTTKVHCDGDALFRLILTTLQTKLGLNLESCVAWQRDSCSTNAAAVNLLMPASANALNMLCFPHTLHNTGKHLELPTLNEFLTPWLQLVPQPGAAKLRWEGILGKGCSKYSKVRWWSRWEIMQEIATNFSSLPDFLASLDVDGIGEASTKKMIDIVTNKRKELELELAAAMSCERLCTATYRLEGDGLELLLTHSTIEALRDFGRTLGNDPSNLPSVAALLRNRHTIAVGTEIREYFGAPYNKWYTGKVTKLPTGASNLYKIKYNEDSETNEYEEQDICNILDVTKLPDWQKGCQYGQRCLQIP